MTTPVRAYVGLGSNLQDPVRQVRCALLALKQLPGTRVVASSSLYRSPPLGDKPQPDYINAVAALDTVLEPHRLLDELQALERRQGRRRGGERWGPRTLDLDLLLYGDLRINTRRLTVPHPGLVERAFVLYPLHEIAPDLHLGAAGPLADLVSGEPAGLTVLPG
ncbi:MAG TPA: 2-amino-4-hydroxy-6-hydroxymethyldihydropteridine diphosphokinase [Gammaproteobacteria bacterium]|nr:2-amino-4-hydroxy-6-hydroxymethyldihydropteridine diphosphokinase [Gammaproteobacteria bacterium]